MNQRIFPQNNNNWSNLELLNSGFMHHLLTTLLSKDAKMIGSLPFYVTMTTKQR